MRILITGGTGFIGGHAALRLKALGHSVTVLGRSAHQGARMEAQGVAFVAADLTDREKTRRAIAGHTAVIHCAALAAPWGPYESFYQANVVGTRHVVDGCLEHGVQRLVNLSTPSVYFDYRPRLGIKESDPLPVRQVTAYGATKLLADAEVARATALGLASVSLRPRAVFGPGDQTVLGRLLRLARRGVVPLIDGGTSYVDFTYIDNFTDALVLALTSGPHTAGRTYNITNGEPMQVRAMVALLADKLGLGVKIRPLPYAAAMTAATASEWAYRLARRRQEPPLTKYMVGLMAKSQTLDISAARRDLGYAPLVTVADGLARYAASCT